MQKSLKTKIKVNLLIKLSYLSIVKSYLCMHSVIHLHIQKPTTSLVS